MDKRFLMAFVFLFAVSSAFATQNITFILGTNNMIKTGIYNVTTYGTQSSIYLIGINSTRSDNYYRIGSGRQDEAEGTTSTYSTITGGGFAVDGARIGYTVNNLYYKEYAQSETAPTVKKNMTFYPNFFDVEWNPLGADDGGTNYNNIIYLRGTTSAEVPSTIYRYTNGTNNDTSFKVGGTTSISTKDFMYIDIATTTSANEGLSLCIVLGNNTVNASVSGYFSATESTPRKDLKLELINAAELKANLYYFPMNITAVEGHNKCWKLFYQGNSSIMPSVNMTTGTASAETSYRLNTVSTVNTTQFTFNSSYDFLYVNNKFSTDMYGRTIYFYVNSSLYTSWTNTSNIWRCDGTASSEVCNTTSVYLEHGKAYAMIYYKPTGASETMYISDTAFGLNVTINSPSNSTYYNNSQIVNFTLATTGITNGDCYFNSTSIGNFLNGETYQTNIFGGFGSNLVNISCVNGITTSQAILWFKINDFLNTSIAHTTPAFEITNNTFGIGFAFNIDLLHNNLTCWMDYNNTARVVQLSSGANATAGYITPLTIANNTANKVSYNCTMAYKNGTTAYNNYTGTPQNLIWAYNITSLTSSKNPAQVGDTITYSINGFEWASEANTNYYLQWNKTDYTGLTTVSGAEHTRAILMPIVNGYNASANVYGVLNVTYGGLRRNMTAPVLSQTIVKPSIVNCTLFPSDDYTAINISGYNEVNRSLIKFNAEANFTITSGTTAYSSSFLMQNETSYVLCMYPIYSNPTFNSTIAYHGTGYSDRFYYHNNASLINTSIRYDSLYLLESTLSDNILFRVTDASGNEYTPATVILERYDPYFGFYTVAMGQVDGNGEVSIPVQSPEALYRKVILRNGVEVYRTTSGEQISTTPTIIKITAGDIIYIYINNYAYSYTQRINETNRYWYFTLTSSASGDTQSRFYVTKKTYVGTETICDLTNTSIGIEYFCSLGTNLTGNTYSASGYVRDTNGQWHLVFTNSTSYRSAVNYAENGLFIAIAIIPTLIFMFSGAEIMGVIAILAVVILSYFQLITDTLLITGLVVMFGIGIVVVIKRRIYP